VKSIVQVINEAVRQADVQCLPCDRVNLDYERHEYRDSDEHRASDLFESPSPSSGAIRVPEITTSIPSILRYFLDGSRRTYQIADLLVRGRYLPLIAGQVGVGVVLRDSSEDSVKPIRDLCSFRNVLAFPDNFTPEDLRNISEQIHGESGCEFEVLRYTVKEDHDPVDLGIAKIMSDMADHELAAVHRLSDMRLLDSSSVLVKDGPLRYKNIKGRGFDVTQFRNVIGLSKTFRPSFAIGTGRRKRDVGAITASLGMGERTPVFKTLEEDRYIGMWYLRMRPPARMTNPLQGIVKVESYAIDDREAQDGLDAERVNTISAHLLRERNVTPYGRDGRWASHIYPIFAAESFIKASFLSDLHFEALF
jgi:hypothetical protein